MNNKEFTLKGTLEEKVSQKGNPYTVLTLKITDTYSKPVFLEKAEIELLVQGSKSTNPFK